MSHMENDGPNSSIKWRSFYVNVTVKNKQYDYYHGCTLSYTVFHFFVVCSRVSLAVFYGLCHQQQTWAPAGVFTEGRGRANGQIQVCKKVDDLFSRLPQNTPLSRGCNNIRLFPPKELFSRHPQNTGLHCKGKLALKTFHFFRRGRLFHGTMASPSLACIGIQWR